jgi:hypothetical protein
MCYQNVVGSISHERGDAVDLDPVSNLGILWGKLVIG